MDIAKLYVDEFIYRERLAQAEHSRQWPHPDATIRLRDRVCLALGARLISWGERLYAPTHPIEAKG
jgi:hypothetical protein